MRDQPVDLPVHSRLLIRHNADQTLSSRGFTQRSQPASTAASTRPRFWGIIVGTHDFRGDELDLMYPAQDAHAIHDALTLAAMGLFGPENVEMKLENE